MKKILLFLSTLLTFSLMPKQDVRANDYFNLNSTNPTWSPAQKKYDTEAAVVNIQKGLWIAGSSVRIDVMTDEYYGGVRESATVPITATSNVKYYLPFYSGYGTIGKSYRLDSWSYKLTDNISGIWAP